MRKWRCGYNLLSSSAFSRWYACRAFEASSARDRQLLMPPVVLTELLSDPKLSRRVADTFSQVPLIEISDGYWQRAGALRAQVLAKWPKARLGDALIAQSCIDQGVSLTSRETIVIIASDHGYHLGEKEISGKNTLWDPSTRVPFFIAGPGIPRRQVANRVELLDIYPTLVELAGLTSRKGLEGESLVPLLASELVR